MRLFFYLPTLIAHLHFFDIFHVHIAHCYFVGFGLISLKQKVFYRHRHSSSPPPHDLYMYFKETVVVTTPCQVRTVSVYLCICVVSSRFAC